MLISLSTLLRGSTYERLKWTFTLYDLNKDGYITKQEVLNVIVAVHELMGFHASPVVSSTTISYGTVSCRPPLLSWSKMSTNTNLLSRMK